MERKDFEEELIKKGFFKRGKTTYVLEGRWYPHDENCEGTMCWCESRAKRKKESQEKT